VDAGLGNIHPSWYVSTLFWTSIAYFYAMKNFDRKKMNFTVAIIVLFCLHFMTLIATKDKNPIPEFSAVFFDAFRRGVCGIGIGYFIGMVWTDFKDRIMAWKPNAWQTAAATAVEICLFANLFYKRNPNQTYSILAFVVLFGLFLSKKGWLSRALDNGFSARLGTYSYSIYITHILVLDLAYKYIWMKNPISSTGRGG
jgi:peptidoglycan/LPS O-acetylase OafA/YrhL